jgi:VCBS repeat protein/ASPIC/UnbV protein/PPIC-type peptidyl-prolyl cis-trans isomerase-like protein
MPRISTPILSSCAEPVVRVYATAISRLACLTLFVLTLLPISFFARAQEPEIHPSEVELGIIVTRTQEQAEDVLRDLRAGWDFCVEAREHSIDSTAVDGGYMGRLNPSQLRAELSAAVSGLKPGQYSTVTRMPNGFAVVTVFAKAPNRPDLDKKRIESMASRAAVRQSIVVSGNGEAKNAFEQFTKPAGWDHDLAQPCNIRKESMADALERMRKLMAEAAAQPPGEVPPRDMLEGYTAVAELNAYVGQMQPSIDAWLGAYKIAQQTFPASIPYLEETLGISYLHLAEMENGVFHANGTMDLFPPIDPHAHFEKQEHSKQAIEYFMRYLEQKPDDYEVRWMLNLAYVTLGQYPAAVPERFLIPPDTFSPAAGNTGTIGRFVDVAPASGLKTFKSSGGIIVDDFDNDGWLDVIASSNDMCEQLQFFHNNGDGTFTERTKQAGLTGQLGGLNIVEADYNNDGCMDLLVLRGGWEFPMRRSLLKNNCDGTFTDVTDQSGLGDTISESQTAAWADIDNDGYVDLFIGREKSPNQLFRNRGDGTFEDISHAAGIDKASFAKGVVAADYDKDGYVDFYVSNISDANLLFHNNHDKTFTDVARMAGVQAPLQSFAAWFFDYDNDGWPDLFVADYYSSVDEVVRSAMGKPFTVETPKLYHNMHNGTFADVTREVGLNRVYLPMGVNFGDIDNDGYLDMYLGMGDPSFVSMMPHVMLRNKDGKKFVDVTAETGTGEIHKGHGIAFADLLHNGQQDIVANMAGAVPSEKHAVRLLRNPGNDNDWINLHLVGVKSNRAAIGATIKITVENDGHIPRFICRTVGGTSSFGGNPMEQHIGLGHGARILSVEIWWPTSKTTQRFESMNKNEYFEIKEFANDYVKLARAPAKHNGGKTVVAGK